MIPPPHRNPLSPAGALLLAIALAAGPGCDVTPPPTEPTDRINVLPERPSLRAEPGVPVSRHAARCLVRNLTLPLNRPLETAWALLDESALPPLSRAVWNANGLRLGVLKASDAEDFAEALGPPIQFADQSLVAINRYTVLRESPRLEARFVADLTRPPAAPILHPFTRGRARMLISAEPAADGATLRFTPQHYLPRTTLVARSPLQKLLDGRVFEELAVGLNLVPGQALVLGYALPTALRPPPPAPPTDEDPADVPRIDGDGPEPEDKPAPDLDIDVATLPLDLGRALFTAGDNRREQQRLVVLSVLETR